MTTTHDVLLSPEVWHSPRDAFGSQWTYNHQQPAAHFQGFGHSQNPLQINTAMDWMHPSHAMHGSQQYGTQHHNFTRPYYYQHTLPGQDHRPYNHQMLPPVSYTHHYAANAMSQMAPYNQPYQQAVPSIPYPYTVRQPQIVYDTRAVPAQKTHPTSCSHCSTPLTQSSGGSFHALQALVAPASPSLPRGPPRKPKRSGHAVWVGNIPMGASIYALKDHFSRDATADIESVFLMARSNCAFVNYRHEDACTSAVERFNHSLFGSVRLLCRLRKEAGNRETSASRTKSKSSSEQSGSATSEIDGVEDLTAVNDKLSGLGIDHGDTEYPLPHADESLSPPVRPLDKPADRYFIVKSLTKEDLQDSLMKGTWETQPHNQIILDEAFREAENVYLIFSVNKSGEYFGYSRMISSPFDDNQSHRSPTPSSNSAEDTTTDGLKITRTAATATAPKGYIVNDPIRGTLFWEAEHSMDESVSSELRSPTDRMETHDYVKSRPFRVEWLSVRRVGFSRTKGLRNAWNSSKEAKVARDGTELETSLGKKIVALFHESYEESNGKA